MIPYGKQDVTDEDVSAVIDVLKSDFLTQGPKVPQFEAALCEYVGVDHAVAVNSATSALHIACASLGLTEGDWLWTSPITFVASANCGLYCGAKVDFVDIDYDTFNIDPAKLEAKLIEADKGGRVPKVLVVVHMAGQSCDMESIREITDRFEVKVIEDASHAIGGKYQGSVIGSCDFSDVTVFSFHPVKIITTAEGGCAVTNNADVAQRLVLLRSHGITKDSSLFEFDCHGDWYYEQQALGYNYRLTDLQAALGVSQLGRIDEYVSRRHELAAIYDSAFEDSGVLPPFRRGDIYSGFHLYILRIDPSRSPNSRRVVFDRLRTSGVGVNVHYIPVHLQPHYRKMGFEIGDFPVAEAYYENALTIPLFPNLSEESQRLVIDSVLQLTS